MKVANIDSKTARTVSHEPINRTAKERRSNCQHSDIKNLHNGGQWHSCYI